MKTEIPNNRSKSTSESDVEALKIRLVAEIIQCHAKSVEAIVATGRKLINAKEQLSSLWGQTETALEWKRLMDQCHMSRSAASKLMKIANNPTINDQKYWQRLPCSSETLYELAQRYEHNTSEFQADLDAQKINKSTTLKELQGVDAPSRKVKESKRTRTKDSEHLSDDVEGVWITLSASIEHKEEFLHVKEKVESMIQQATWLELTSNFPTAAA